MNRSRGHLCGLSLFITLGLVGCGSSDLVSTKSSANDSGVVSKSTLSSQAAVNPITCTAEPKIVNIFTPSQDFPADITGALSDTTVQHLARSSYVKGALAALGLSSDINVWRATSKQTRNSDGSMTVALGVNAATKFVVYFDMQEPMVGTMTQKWVACNGEDIEVLNSYQVNNIDTRARNVQTISYQSLESGTLVTMGKIAPSISGVLNGQSVTQASTDSRESAFIISGQNEVLSSYDRPGIEYLTVTARRNTPLTAQAIIVTPVSSEVDPRCSGNDVGGISNQSIIVCPAPTSPEVVGPIEASRTKSNAYKCADAYDEWQEAQHEQSSLGWATTATALTGGGGVLAHIYAPPAAVSTGTTTVTIGAILATPVAYEKWQSSGYKTRRLERAYRKCLAENNVI